MDIGAMLSKWFPTVFTILFVIGIYYLVKYILDKSSKNRVEDSSLLRTILLLCIGLIGAIIIILAIPMPDSLKGQVTSLIGIVISAILALSSATFFGNGLAGIMLRSINNFRTGDFIQVNDHFGRVSERGLFHTEIQTENRDLITLPNMMLATNPVRVVRTSGTFVEGVVSLGYDVNQNYIKETLLKAAKNAGLGDPFVRVAELGDFSVLYKVYGMLKDAKTIVAAKSKLNSEMLDSLHDAGIEIVSPTFMNQRQVAGTIFIPKKVHLKTEVAESEKAENLVFDKAEEAESIEKRKGNVAEIQTKITELEKEMKSTDEHSLLEMRERLDKLQRIRDTMKARIEDKIEKLGSDS